MKRGRRIFLRDVDAAFRVLLAGLVVAAGMPQARGATLLTWDITGTTGSTTFNGMQWDGNVRMNGGTIQINGGNIQGSGTIQIVGAVANTLAQRLNFNSPDIATPVSVADG